MLLQLLVSPPFTRSLTELTFVQKDVPAYKIIQDIIGYGDI